MIVEVREPKESDCDDILRAVKIIREMIKMNPGIDGAIWLSSFNFIMVDAACLAGLTLSDFEDELDKVRGFFKLRLEEACE